MLIGTGIKGLSITIGTDGVWLNTSAATGKHASFNLRNVANSKGSITRQAIFDWCDEITKANKKAMHSDSESEPKNTTKYDG